MCRVRSGEGRKSALTTIDRLSEYPVDTVVSQGVLMRMRAFNAVNLRLDYLQMSIVLPQEVLYAGDGETV